MTVYLSNSSDPERTLPVPRQRPLATFEPATRAGQVWWVSDVAFWWVFGLRRYASKFAHDQNPLDKL
jgi:hypothetical protein